MGASAGVRYAPSPTGRFHVGNLRTAWVSAKWARALGTPWIVRFEDIDEPRVVAGARERQLEDLAALGLVPDEVNLQTSRRERHYALFLRAAAEGAIYPCTCSRKEVQDALSGIASAPHGRPGSAATTAPIYTGHCRNAAIAAKPGPGGVAWRFRSADEAGAQDFIVARTSSAADPRILPSVADASFVPAYHWACAIDDFDGKYRLLVRAWDLAESTPLQREIGEWISKGEGSVFEAPAVYHASLVVRNDGHRLEKRTAGVTLPELRSAGWTAERLLAQFEASFDFDPSDLSPGRIFGETARERTLADLGI
ncbi:MAG: hypothetical protein JST04_16170 [Bdellovibrionales bacterium]|nr:hypothetical protein [Bdellovibrionales bacterium]